MEILLIIVTVIAVYYWCKLSSNKNRDYSSNQKSTDIHSYRNKNDIEFIKNIVARERDSQKQLRDAQIRSAKRNISQADNMSGEDFEKYVANIYRDLGFNVELTPKSGDQGVDIIVTLGGGERLAVQTKRYDSPVGNYAVQEVIAGRVFYGCQKAAVVTNNKFTVSAKDLSKKDGNVELVDRDSLSLLITRAANRKNTI
jgi:HJR/Mrr/RecB family endonuclease